MVPGIKFVSCLLSHFGGLDFTLHPSDLDEVGKQYCFWINSCHSREMRYSPAGVSALSFRKIDSIDHTGMSASQASVEVSVNIEDKESYTFKNKKYGLIPVLLVIVITYVLVAGIAGIIFIQSLLSIRLLAIDTRDRILPTVVENHRTAINLEKLSRFGEIILLTKDSDRLRETRLAAQLLCNDSIYENNPDVKDRMKETYQLLLKIIELRKQEDTIAHEIFQRLVSVNNLIRQLNQYPIKNDKILSKEQVELIENLISFQIFLIEGYLESSPHQLTVTYEQSVNLASKIISQSKKTLYESISPIHLTIESALEIFSLRQSIIQNNDTCVNLWKKMVVLINEMTDKLSMKAAVTSANRFTLIIKNAEQALVICLIVFLIIMLLVILLVFFVQKHIIKPILHATYGISLIEKEHPEISLPDVWLKEPNAVVRSVEKLGGVVKELRETRQQLYDSNKRLKEMVDELGFANKKIMDSITYAKLIQRSLLPRQDVIQQFIPNIFSIWEPRDIVGGDMLYADVVNNAFIGAVMDCTGHGVPGAFMAIIAVSCLKRITTNEGCLDPAEILKRLNVSVKTLLHQDVNTPPLSDDGLDACVFYINPNLSQLVFASARLPIVYVNKGNISVIKGDKKSIGYRKSHTNYTFTNHSFCIEKGMFFYIFTDGFVTQLGGDRNLPFSQKKLLRLIEKNYTQPFKKQRELFLNEFISYMGNNERQDDVTLIGFGF